MDISTATRDDLERGETYTGTVDRISGSGNALIEMENHHINLGPIDPSALGEEVEFRYLKGPWAKCLTDEYTSRTYDPYNGRSKKKQKQRNQKQRNRSNPMKSQKNDKNDLLKGKL